MNNPILEKKKAWFKRYDNLLQAEERLQRKLNHLRERMITIRSPICDAMPRGGSPVTIADMVANEEELERRVSSLHTRAVSCKAEILTAIDTLEDPMQADILESLFIRRESIDRIAEDLGYTSRSVYRIYSKAIELVDTPINTDISIRS